jgi:hypothetical protein
MVGIDRRGGGQRGRAGGLRILHASQFRDSLGAVLSRLRQTGQPPPHKAVFRSAIVRRPSPTPHETRKTLFGPPNRPITHRESRQ